MAENTFPIDDEIIEWNEQENIIQEDSTKLICIFILPDLHFIITVHSLPNEGL